jgi:hypothetical protein
MDRHTSHAPDAHLHALSAAVRAAASLERMENPEARARGGPAPFVTISRQAGTGGRSLAGALVERLNRGRGGAPAWTAWDDELVTRVAQEHHLPVRLVEALEDGRHDWFRELLESVAAPGGPGADEFRVYRRVAATARALAEAGCVVVVGRGGVHLTRDLVGGVHVRLVAPWEYRVERLAQQYCIPEDVAVERLRVLDRNREAFHRRYWPGQPLTPDRFSVTLNAAAAPVGALAACVVPLVEESLSRRLPVERSRVRP